MARDILDEIITYKRQEIAERKQATPLDVLKEELDGRHMPPVASMRRSLTERPFGIISEFKRRSPSKDWINREARATEVPLSYQENGAAAISILTDSHFFAGENAFVGEARAAGVTLPVLYKNFVIDEYQLYEARLSGASAVLLIAACLSVERCNELNILAHKLGMETLLEVHSEKELIYTQLYPDMVGVNNRNLGTFVTDVDNSFRLSKQLPDNVCKVSESGISRPETVAKLVRAGFNGFLIGETFMKTANPGQALGSFISDVKLCLHRQ